MKKSGEIKFTLEEGIQIQEQWFSDISVNELFRKNETEKGDETT